MRKPSSFGGPAAVVLGLSLLMLAALSVPMQRGASLWQAIAVLPQAVLWAIPLVVAAPVLFALALRIRPHWHSVRDRARDDVPTGSLGPLADALRRAGESRFSRSQVIARLIRLSTNLAASRADGAETEDVAWEHARRKLEEAVPRVAAFLRHEQVPLLSRAEFRDLVDETLRYLERQQEEA